MPGHDVLSRAIRQRIRDGASLGCRRLSARLAFRSIGKRVKQYPDKDRRQVLDLIEARGEPPTSTPLAVAPVIRPHRDTTNGRGCHP